MIIYTDWSLKVLKIILKPLNISKPKLSSNSVTTKQKELTTQNYCKFYVLPVIGMILELIGNFNYYLLISHNFSNLEFLEFVKLLSFVKVYKDKNGTKFKKYGDLLFVKIMGFMGEQNNFMNFPRIFICKIINGLTANQYNFIYCYFNLCSTTFISHYQ